MCVRKRVTWNFPTGKRRACSLEVILLVIFTQGMLMTTKYR